MANIRFQFRSPLVTFLQSPTKDNLTELHAQTLADIKERMNLLGDAFAVKVHSEIDEAVQNLPMHIQDMIEDVEKADRLLFYTERFHELEENNQLELMTEIEEEKLYRTTPSVRSPAARWFISNGALVAPMDNNEAKAWYEQNSLEDVSPFHKADAS